MAPAPIPVTVIGGYLGAGKTTLLNRLLAGASDERLAVLVNDFGAIAVDAALVERRDDDTIRLTNGCVCCSLAGGFVEAMQRIASLQPAPDRLVVETSGVADPGAVAQWAHLPGFALDAVVVLADAETVRRKAADTLVGRHVLRQLASADVVVLNKADLVDEERLRTTTAWVAEHAPGTPVVTAVEADVPLGLLLGPIGAPRYGTGHADHGPDRAHTHHHAHPQHVAVTITGTSAVERVLLERSLDSLGPAAVRAKGFVDLLDDGVPAGTHLVQRVGTRCRIVPHQSTTRPAARADAPSGGVALVVLGLADSDVVAASRRLADDLAATVVDTTGVA